MAEETRRSGGIETALSAKEEVKALLQGKSVRRPFRFILTFQIL